MSSCSVDGNADMYGLGIRLGFYLNWNAGILANLVAVQEIETIRYAFTCFIGATFLALVVQTVQGDNLTALDTYIVLLLCFGYYCSLVPTWLWRLATCFNPKLDPTRWPRLKPSQTFMYAHVALVAAVAAFQLWFWFAEVPKAAACSYRGFLFVKFRLTDVVFKYVNIAFQALILAICVTSVAAQLLGREGSPSVRISERHKSTLRILYAVMLFIVASLITVATELTIAWNRVTDVNELNSAGQLIPFIVGVGVLGRVVYLAIRGGLSSAPPGKMGTHGRDDMTAMGGHYVHLPTAMPYDESTTIDASSSGGGPYGPVHKPYTPEGWNFLPPISPYVANSTSVPMPAVGISHPMSAANNPVRSSLPPYETGGLPHPNSPYEIGTGYAHGRHELYDADQPTGNYSIMTPTIGNPNIR
ncbi:uncharacterized protein B0I36DRAFT_389197 [Microdochium trichocladiopsis]|uniref:Uncharacterized protein n=1 Tax=Microdochium trichocladiopsis TaxID=1682393 RepID=A0A9P8XTU8_9PEZI|nr:uncharacterized protein B0I36DRAFT_389197 [Microdochium trichocladiopsis]KAH7014239.1 hypothetical protein B0I36DRAFT_389197 [Microdochium trichocladiopsis]